MQDLTRSSLLRLVCIDEVHQFVDFGLTFRYKFASLKKPLFKRIIVNENSAKLKVPVLFMRAPFNEYLLKLLEKLTGVHMNECNFIWSKKQMMRHNIDIKFSTSPRYISILKKML